MRVIVPSLLSEYRCSSSSVNPAAIRHVDRDQHLDDHLAIASEHIEHLEVLDLHRRHVGEELGDAGPAMPRLRRRQARFLPVVVEPRLPRAVIRDLTKDEVDVAMTEGFIDVADDGDVGGGAILGGTSDTAGISLMRRSSSSFVCSSSNGGRALRCSKWSSTHP